LSNPSGLTQLITTLARKRRCEFGDNVVVAVDWGGQQDQVEGFGSLGVRGAVDRAGTRSLVEFGGRCDCCWRVR
jgi:hypothetical protein